MTIELLRTPNLKSNNVIETGKELKTLMKKKDID